MAPITIAGAITLQHAEALAGIALAQITRKGAPVVYGSFSSNVDMKSGAPAFGTPEHFKATLGSGQLARLPRPALARRRRQRRQHLRRAGAPMRRRWRSGAPCSPAAPSWCIPAGWLEGGLAFSYEKMITDLEVLQSVAELCAATPADADAIGFDAIAEVQPGGHFFATTQTMARYRSAFYEPLVADLSNFGNWTEAGSKTATERAPNHLAPHRGRVPAAGLDPRHRGDSRSLHRAAYCRRRRRAGVVTGLFRRRGFPVKPHHPSLSRSPSPMAKAASKAATRS